MAWSIKPPGHRRTKRSSTTASFSYKTTRHTSQSPNSPDRWWSLIASTHPETNVKFVIVAIEAESKGHTAKINKYSEDPMPLQKIFTLLLSSVA
uniref:Uncharacterized protein n=1 Tax=Hyaloperonospora arabidopsidis (strain Emoy2) TaxID=559515 RepID=M4C039_HYAAE